MTVTLHLKPGTQAGLAELAQAAGMSVEDYVLAMVEGNLPAQTGKTALTPEERAAAWIESAKRFPDSPPLSDEAVSRENMYSDPR